MVREFFLSGAAASPNSSGISLRDCRLIGHQLRGRLYDDRLERLLDLTPRAPARA